MLLVLLLTAATAYSAKATGAVGATTAEFTVDRDDNATYLIPITVLHGAAGMSPSLLLAYSSSGGNGPLGVGFSLGGLSSITRCPATLEHDGFIDGVDLDDNDRLCLDGHRLVAVKGGYGESGAEYRTELESFTRVLQFGDLNGGTTTFRAWNKAGLVTDFGGEGASVKAPGLASYGIRPVSLAWNVRRVSDTSSNYMEVSYDQDRGTREHRLIRIDYTGNSSAGLTPYNSVRFEYESRPDQQTSFVDGGQIRAVSRLKTIRTYHGETPAREYRLGYVATGAASRSILTSITECATGTCLGSTNFEWSPEVAGFEGSPQDTGIRSAEDVTHPELAGDFNNDGISDLMVWVNGPGSDDRNDLALGDGYGGFETPIRTTVTSFNNAALDNQEVGDFDGDGLPDLLTWHRPFAFKFGLHRNNGNGFDPAIETAIETFDNPYLRNIAADFTGDGQADLLVWHMPFNNARYNLYRSTGSGFAPPVATSVPGYANPNVTNVEVGDFNGDGLPDLLTWHEPFSGVYAIHLNNGSGFDAAVKTDIGTEGNSYVRNIPGDFNGDGKTDYLVWHEPS